MLALIRFSLVIILLCTSCNSNPVAPDVLLGDVNLDRTITQQDAALLMKYICNQATLSKEALTNADISCDGRINQEDAYIITNLCTELSHD